ncbi:hypothetical protein EUGRSUZ_B02730 [Eucalyptus grandis]|uniref:Uncharacterized protein n=2 Tax=Eucalyptus grandis TaxID=71139 RepID=A0ACC3M222_EUCGR|nr:hypothetical protein EUGRSUZ_B02730 [Eucalyptus grandis]
MVKEGASHKREAGKPESSRGQQEKRERERKSDGRVQALFSAPAVASGRRLCIRRRAARRIEDVAELPISATWVLEDPGDARSRLQVLRRRRRVYSYMGRVLLQAPMSTVETRLRLRRMPPFLSFSSVHSLDTSPLVELDRPHV